MAGASALKWTTRTEALSQSGAGSSSRTWAVMEATASVAAIVYLAPAATVTSASMTGLSVVPVAKTLTLCSPAGISR